MSIFIASTQSISRGKGQSAVAAASYRAGVELEDQRYGKTHDYSKRHGVMSAKIILPSALGDAVMERGILWNMAEAVEKRKDARVGREWLINLPYQLNEQEREELAHTFAQTLADRYDTIADCAIHQPTAKEIKRGADARNFHAHILFTTRKAALDDQGEVILTDKATIELSDTKRRQLDMARVSEEIKEVRLLWEQIANAKLSEQGHDLIDARSYQEMGIDIIPQLKMGKQATHLERKAVPTTHGNRNRQIAERNALVWRSQLDDNQKINDKAEQIIAAKRKEHDNALIKRIKWTTQSSEWATQRTKRVDEIIGTSQQRIDGYEQETSELTRSLSNYDGQQRCTNSLIADHLSPKAPSPYSIAKRITDTQRRIDDTKRAIFGRHYDIRELSQRVDDILEKRAYAIAWRFYRNYYLLHHRELIRYTEKDNDIRLDVRQQGILTQFSIEHELIPKDEKDNYEYRSQLTAFFKSSENIEKQEKFINMLLDPKGEQLIHDKTLSEAHQEALNHNIYLNTINGVNTSQEVLEEPSLPRYTPRR